MEYTWPVVQPRRLNRRSRPSTRGARSPERGDLASTIASTLKSQVSTVRARYQQTITHIREKVLNIPSSQSQGPPGLLYAVQNVPAHIPREELVSALDLTVETLFSGAGPRNNFPGAIEAPARSLLDADLFSPDDLDHFAFPCLQPAPPGPSLHVISPPDERATSEPVRPVGNTGILLPDLIDLSLPEQPPASPRHSQSFTIDELLFETVTNELPTPLTPATWQLPSSQSRMVPCSQGCPTPDPDRFPDLLSFDGMSPYPLLSRAQISSAGMTEMGRSGLTDPRERKELSRKKGADNLREGEVALPELKPIVPMPSPTRSSHRRSTPSCLKPGYPVSRAPTPRPCQVREMQGNWLRHKAPTAASLSSLTQPVLPLRRTSNTRGEAHVPWRNFGQQSGRPRPILVKDQLSRATLAAILAVDAGVFRGRKVEDNAGTCFSIGSTRPGGK